MKIQKIKDSFARVPNEIVVDPALSLKAKGMLVYIQSKPDDYDFSSERIVDETKDGLDAVKSALKELEVTGYLTRTRLQSGKVDYVLNFPKVENPSGGNSPQGKIQRISKKEITTSNINNKDIVTYAGENPPVGKIVGHGTPEEEVVSTPSSDTQNFFSMIIEKGEAFQIFVTQMAEKTKFPPAMVASELQHFTLHWTERNKSGTKQRWETEKTFEVKRRLVTWFNNKRTNFGRNKSATINGVENKYQVNFSNQNV